MKKKLSGLDKTLIFVAIIVVLFTISMIVIFWFKGDVPNVLISAVFGATFAECGFCSYIWKQKITNDSLKAKIEISREEKQNESGTIEDDIGTNYDDNYITDNISSSPIPEEQNWSGEIEQAADLYGDSSEICRTGL